MHHVPSPVLRRLVDEPLAVPDLARRHLAGCGRCRAQSTEIAGDAALAARVLGGPPEIADIDLEWILLQERLSGPDAAQRPAARPSRRMPRRLASVSVGAGTAVVAGVLAVGAAAAAVLTTVYAPTQVAPVRVSANDLQAIENITGIGQLPRGLQPSGSMRLTFGDLSWATAGRAQQVSSLASASAMTHLAFPAPATLPSGVGAVSSIEVQPQVTATVRFSQNAGPAVAGSTLEITVGPAIAVQYSGTSGRSNLITLAIVAVRRPVASMKGDGEAGGATAQPARDVPAVTAGPAGRAGPGNPAARQPRHGPSGAGPVRAVGAAGAHRRGAGGAGHRPQRLCLRGDLGEP